MKELWQPLTNYCRDVKMFSVVRSVILDRRECVCMCGSCWFSCFLPLFLHPHTVTMESRVDGLVTLLSDLRFTLLHTLPVADTHRVTPLASALLMDRTATSSHDGALLCCPGPRASWEIEGLHVKVKAWRLEEGKKKQEDCGHL